LLAECNKALEANSSVATDESQSTITIAECSPAKSAVVTAELQTIDNKVDIYHNFSNNYLHV
jgi:hypothetical protein